MNKFLFPQEKTWNVAAAQEALEKQLSESREETGVLLAQRAAQVKYVINQLSDSLPRKDSEKLDIISPPRTGDALSSYALDALRTWENNPLRQGLITNDTTAKWALELEELLEEMRRHVVQRISKNPAMKPFRLLTELSEKKEELHHLRNEKYQIERELNQAEQELRSFQSSEEELAHHPEALTFARLHDSRKTLIERREAWVEKWLEQWKKVEGIMVMLSESTNAFDKMENAQRRIMQLYLINPIRASSRDVHGHGLRMLLNKMVDGLEEKKTNIPPGQKKKAQAALLDAFENPFFVDFFDEKTKLDHAIDANFRETTQHVLYRPAIELGALIGKNVRDKEKLLEERTRIEEEIHAKEKELSSHAQDTIDACRMVGITLKID